MCKCNFVLSVKETSSMHGFAVVHLRLFCRYIAVFFPYGHGIGSAKYALTITMMYVIIFTCIGAGGRNGQDPAARSGQVGVAARNTER